MKKSSNYKKAMLALLPVVTLMGCDSAEPAVEVGHESCIEIAGGDPAGLALTSRTISEPSRPGFCDADMLRIWAYRGVTINTVKPAVDNMSFLSESGEIPVTHYSGENNCNKWTSYQFNCVADGARNTGYAMPSLAYSSADKDAFVVDASTDANYAGLKLSLTGTATPELYFGRVRFEVYNSKKENQMQEASDGIFYAYNSGVRREYRDCPVTGKLFRLVSQLNVTISDVNVDAVRKMEMYLSNVPTELPLFGNHGAYYPVGSASAHSTTGDILVASTEDFRSGIARLSTFLLPSAEGRSMKIRIYYAEGSGVDENGNKRTYKDYDIRPPKSFFLTGDDAEVYYAGAAEQLRHGSDLYVYNGTDNMFYSYANVRVNISGDFANVFAETAVTDVNIEVCPTFERQHDDFVIN